MSNNRCINATNNIRKIPKKQRRILPNFTVKHGTRSFGTRNRFVPGRVVSKQIINKNNYQHDKHSCNTSIVEPKTKQSSNSNKNNNQSHNTSIIKSKTKQPLNSNNNNQSNNISIMESKINQPSSINTLNVSTKTHTTNQTKSIEIHVSTTDSSSTEDDGSLNLFENIPDNTSDNIVIVDDVTEDVVVNVDTNNNTQENLDENDVDDNSVSVESLSETQDKQENIDYIQLGDTTIPAVPFLWYREKQLHCPTSKIIKTTKEYMELLLKKYDSDANIKTSATDYYIIIQRHVVPNESVYVAYHGYAYYADTKNKNILADFNKKYTFSSTCMPLTDGVIFMPGTTNYKLDEYINGSVHIHNQALSPPDNFKFKIDSDADNVSMLIHGYNNELKLDCLCMFIIMNDFEE